MVGPLVARVGLVPDEVLLGQILTLHATGRGRVLAPLGLGDGLSDAENEAYGLERAPLEERRDRLGHLLDALAREGIPTWVGGTGPKTVALARSHGAAVNAWASSLDVVASLASEGEVTWAGDLPADLDDADRFLDGLHEAGASWVVATYGTEISTLADLVTPKPWFAAR
jgi:hypothetical protein